MLRNNPRQVASFIWYRAVAEIKAESARAFIGLLWWVAEPVLYMLVFYVVFAVGFRMGGPNFVPFLLTGLVAWKWFASTVQSSAGVYLNNQGLLSQVDVPKYALVATTVLISSLKFLVIFVLLALFLAYLGIHPTPAWVHLLPTLAALLIVITGLSAIVAFVTVFIPDVRLLVDNGVLLLFFMSGIFFDISEREPEVQELLLLNPLARWLISFRDTILNGEPPVWIDILQIAVIGLVMAIVGFALLAKFDRQIARASV